MLILILTFTFLGSIISLIGGILLLLKKKISSSAQLTLTSFAAGVLLATVFFDLLPEALHETDNYLRPLQWSLAGIVAFFLFEHFFRWYHSHQAHGDAKPSVWLITIGDTLHNFLDGIAIGASFLINPALGITTSFAVAAHEIPHEIADFGVLLSQGIGKRKTLIFNLISAASAFLGAIAVYYSGDSIKPHLSNIIAFTAGQFIYIAAADFIPELHHNSDKKTSPWPQAFIFLFGILLFIAIKSLLE